jgi:transaldolase / glucose-6-phosphate isomerase
MSLNFANLRSTIQSINALGQSIWVDNLSREVIDSGELSKLIEAGVSGITTNPTIFKNSIVGSAIYSQSIADLSRRGFASESICQELFINDVRDAAKVLNKVYVGSEGKDGFVSIEVSPLLAKNKEETIKEGRKLWEAIGMKNIMIKVPATPEGIPAIQALLEEGINVNVTLIFSIEAYQQVINAYVEALRGRIKKGETVKNIASVASFFVSRVDTALEKKIAAFSQKERYEDLSGKVAIANSIIAYSLFLSNIQSEAYKEIINDGGAVQRPLWASTSTKNPSFHPLHYVKALIGDATVNTVPPQTVSSLGEEALTVGQCSEEALLAIKEGGMFTAERLKKYEGEVEKASLLIGGLKDREINFETVISELLQEGVESFTQSYKDLLKSVEEKLH